MPENNITGMGKNGDKTIKYRRLKPYSTAEIKVLLLENINPVAVELFKAAGYQVALRSLAGVF